MSHDGTVYEELRGRSLPGLRRDEAASYCNRLGLDTGGTRSALLRRLRGALPRANATTRSAITPPTSSTAQAIPVLPPHLTTTLVSPSSAASGASLVASSTSPQPGLSTSTTSAWVQSIAQQAAQSAVNQVLQLYSAGSTLQPGVLPQLGSAPTYTTNSLPAQGLPAPTIVPTVNPGVTIDQSFSVVPPTSQPTTTLPTLPGNTSSIIQLPPVLPGVTIGASTAITGYNLPGELPGMLTHNIISKIISLQYFDLSSLLPSNLAQARHTQQIRVHVGGDDGQQLLVSRRPQTKKPISSISDWTLAFCTYASVLTTVDQTRGPDLFEYARIIVQAEREYKNDSWLRYDTAFRTRAANCHIVRWANIDSTLWNRAFSGMSKESACCSICLDTNHSINECPLYTQGPAPRRNTGSAGPSTFSGSIPSPTITRQVCLNWNRGKCRFPNCRRAHVCATQGCGGDHRYSDCPKRRHSPRKPTNSSN